MFYFDLSVVFSPYPVCMGFSISSYLVYSVLVKLYSICCFMFIFMSVFMFFCFREESWGCNTQPNIFIFDMSHSSKSISFLSFQWVVVSFPLFSMLFMFLFSSGSLSFSNTFVESAEIIHLVSYQWGWEVFYPFLDMSFFSLPCVDSKEMKDSVNPLVISSGLPSIIMTSSVDVMHSLSIDGLGVKIDCVPGHLNSVIVVPESEGVVFGNCSEFCGINHSFMGLSVEVIDGLDLFSFEGKSCANSFLFFKTLLSSC